MGRLIDDLLALSRVTRGNLSRREVDLGALARELLDGGGWEVVWLSRTFYNEYDSTAMNNLISIGVHEIAHQWWFALVANDQALEPWLDESLCTYSEWIFYKHTYPNLAGWWWNFRVKPFSPSGFVNTSIYEGGSFRPYVNAVYLRGAYFLDAIRVRVGDDAF